MMGGFPKMVKMLSICWTWINVTTKPLFKFLKVLSSVINYPSSKSVSFIERTSDLVGILSLMIG